jgi:hypothetical protein
MAPQRIGLDSNCLSYLIGAATQSSVGGTPIDEEGVALIRAWLYAPSRFFITETVAKECGNIRDEQKLAVHSSFTSHTFWGIPINDLAATRRRANELKVLHSGEADCLTLAEAEDGALDVLLTYDRKFLRLGVTSGTKVQLCRPTAHWASLAIPKGAPLVNRPTQGNPLEGQTWWLWQ